MAIHIPADFVLANADLNWGDVAYGLEKGFLDRNDIIKIALEFVSKNDDASETEIELAGLLRNASNRVADLVAVLALNHDSCVDTSSKWLYLALAWLYNRRESVDDPLGLVEEIYADFDYPERVSSFVRYMPPSDGYRPQDHSPDDNRERLFRLWREYLLEQEPKMLPRNL